MATRQEDRPGVVEQAQQKGEELVSQAQEQAQEKAQELRGEAEVRLREQVDRRSTQAGEQVQSIGKVLQSGANQLRSEGNELPAKAVEQVARRAGDLGGYLQSAQTDRILDDIERFARRRPWLTAGVGVLAGFLASRFVKASGERRYEGAQSNGRGLDSPSTQRSLTTGGADDDR